MKEADFQDKEKLHVAKAAVKLVKANDIVGLGTGTTATFAIRELAKLVQDGLKIQGVPSSEHTRNLATSLGIPLLELGKISAIDISIDGADEFNAQLNLIKGGGGALFREKIMASLSKNQIIVTDSTKKVEKLGAFKVPVEILPSAFQYVIDRVQSLGGESTLRVNNNEIFVTDNGNWIIDVNFGLINDPKSLANQLDHIVGVVAHGIFVDLTAIILMAKGEEIITYKKA